MKRIVTILLAASASLMASFAAATPTLESFAANGATTIVNCNYNQAGNRCPKPSPTSHTAATISSDRTSISGETVDARGRAAVSAELSSSTYLPTLHAYAYTNPATSVVASGPYGASVFADANVWGVQGYRYTGATPFLLTLTATLDSVFTQANPELELNHSGFRVSIFDIEGYEFGYFTDYGSRVAAPELCPLIMASPGGLCPTMPTVHAFERKLLLGTGSVSATLSYLVQPGQAFYVGAFLDAGACCGSTVDSSHTLNLAFNDFTQLDSVAVTIAEVPEPSSTLLAVLALVMLAAFKHVVKSASLAPASTV